MKKNSCILLIIILFVGCRSKESEKKMINFPDIFETAFIDKTRVQDGDFEIEFQKKTIGQLKIPTGKIIACDPLVLFEHEPFLEQFPIGEFPVELSIAHILTDQRIAFSRILFSNLTVNKWDYALLKGQDPKTLKENEIFGYGVDSGTGGFMDIKAHSALTKAMDLNENLFETIIELMDKTYIHTRSWCLFPIDGLNVAFFSSGEGDGVYQSYIGYDANGNICRLLTDFYVVSWDQN